MSRSQIKEHMQVKGSDGKHVGTVLGVENGRLKLASGGMEHAIEIDMVDMTMRSACARLPRKRSRPGTKVAVEAR